MKQSKQAILDKKLLRSRKRWTPRSYQLTALLFVLMRPYSGMFLDPGLGKTSITLAVIRLLKFGTKKSNKHLIIAPKSVIWTTWPNELKKWRNFQNLEFVILHGDMKDYLLWNSTADIFIINPAGLVWLSEALLTGLGEGKPKPFNCLWVDESTKFKNHKAPTLFETIAPMLPLFKRRHIMTGTPTAKSYEDLWSQIYILDQGKALEDNFYHFRQKYFVSIASTLKAEIRKKLPPKDHRRRSFIVKKGFDIKAVLTEKISHLIIDMSEKDHLDLPPLVYNPIYVELPPDARKAYNQMEKDSLAYIEEHKLTAQAAMARLIPCQQIANGQVYESPPNPDMSEKKFKKWLKTRKVIKAHTQKVEALKDLVESLQGKPLLIVYWYKHDLAAIEKALGPVAAMNAQTTKAQTVQYERDWNKGKLPVLAGHPDRLAHGLNLQDGPGRDLACFSLFWSAENRRQVVKRIHRQGVNSKVTVHDIISRNTLDEVMYSRWSSREKAEVDLRKLLRQYKQERKI